jgi:starch synthase
MDKRKIILHITSEVAPFYKRGGLGDVVGALPRYLENCLYRNIVVSLFYDGMMHHLDDARVWRLNSSYNGIPYRATVYSVRRDGISYYFLQMDDAEVLNSLEDNDGNAPYSSSSVVLPYLYFGRLVWQLVEEETIAPDFVFCHDWQAAGFYGFPELAAAVSVKRSFKSLFLIHNYEFQGDIYEDSYPYLESGTVTQLHPIFTSFRSASLLSLGLKNSDAVGTVSRGYARELMEGRAPHRGLKHLRLCGRQVLGLLNGIDPSIWRPDKSPYVPVKYTAADVEVKREIKGEFLRQYGFENPDDVDAPLALMLCRLTPQKGIGLFTGNGAPLEDRFMRRLLRLVPRFVIAGNPGGGRQGTVHRRLKELERRFAGKLLYLDHYSEELAHKSLAASDMLVAPSLFEPCGLIQVYAMAFGTVPLVRPVGGMKDTVTCFRQDPQKATGFYIERFCREALLEALAAAVEIYLGDPRLWRDIMQRGMELDFSWNRMKRQYETLLLEWQRNPGIDFTRLDRAICRACPV